MFCVCVCVLLLKCVSQMIRKRDKSFGVSVDFWTRNFSIQHLTNQLTNQLNAKGLSWSDEYIGWQTVYSFRSINHEPVGSFDIFKVLCFCGFFLSRPSHCQKLDDCVACCFGQLTLGNESFAALHKSSFIKVGLSVESKTQQNKWTI